MKKRFLVGLIVFFSLNVNAMAVDLNDIVNGIIGDIWGILDKSTNQIASVCYTPSNSSSSLDACSLLNKLGDLELNVCSLAPPIPGFTKKSRNVSLSGLKRLCEAQAKDFADISSISASNVAENLIDESGLSEKTTLPNGMKVDDYLKRWDVSNILQDTAGTNLARTYFMGDNQKNLKLLMDYDKSANSNGKSVSQIKIKDIKAPKDLQTYRKNRQELAESLYNNKKETSATSISSSVSLAIDGKKNTDAQNTARNFLTMKKNQIQTAKANEVGQALQIYSNRNDTVAIPTQEAVEGLREDLQPILVARIRQQQIEEAQIIADINEKWDRREAVVELMVDKEVIMNETFDEAAAKAEIEKVVAQAQN